MSAKGVSRPFKRPRRVTVLLEWNHSSSPAQQTVRQMETDSAPLHHICHRASRGRSPETPNITSVIHSTPAEDIKPTDSILAGVLRPLLRTGTVLVVSISSGGQQATPL